MLEYRGEPQKAMGMSMTETSLKGQMRNVLPVTEANHKPQRQRMEKTKAREERTSNNREETGARWSRNVETL